MQSLSPEINALFDAYREVSNVPGLPMTMLFERLIFESHQAGLTPEMVKAVITSRKQRKRAGEYGVRRTYFSSIFGDENVAWVIDEFHHIIAEARVRMLPKGKAEVLRATGRDASPQGNPVVTSSEVVEKLKEGYSGLRKEAGL